MAMTAQKMNMTFEEVIEAIDNVLNSEYRYDESLGYQLTSDDFEWLEKAKDAVSKQIKKKPNSIYCPTCGDMTVVDGEYGEKLSYCSSCGQALD